jgi:hypothetical protein
MDKNSVIISRHAIDRFRKRTGSKKSDDAIQKQLLRFLEDGKEVQPTGNYGVVQLLNHNLKPASYFAYGSFILVVEDNVLVTIHSNESKRWKIPK